eukprot:1138786-Pyramimonas_sp.AAC.1
MNTKRFPGGVLGTASMCAPTKQVLSDIMLWRCYRIYWEIYRDCRVPTRTSIGVVHDLRRTLTYWDLYRDGTRPTGNSIKMVQDMLWTYWDRDGTGPTGNSIEIEQDLLGTL